MSVSWASWGGADGVANGTHDEESIALLQQLGSLETSASSKRSLRATLQRELDDVESQMRALATSARIRTPTCPSRRPTIGRG